MGKVEGTVKQYYVNGQLKREVPFKRNAMHGEEKRFDEDGTPLPSRYWLKGDKVSKTEFALYISKKAAGDSPRTWKTISKKTHPGLAGDAIQFIKPIEDEVWAGTLSGLSVYRDGTFTTVKQEKNGKKAEFQAWDIVKTGPGTYVTGTNRGLYYLKEGRVGAPVLAGKTVCPVLRYNKDTLWALGKDQRTEVNKIYENSSGEWKPVELFEGKKVADMIKTSGGRIWVIINGDGVIRVDPSKGLESASRHQRGVNIQDVFTDTTGRVWCGTWERGVSVLEDGSWTSCLAREKFAVMSIAEDKKHNIWVATNASGLWCFDGTSWKIHLKDGVFVF